MKAIPQVRFTLQVVFVYFFLLNSVNAALLDDYPQNEAATILTTGQEIFLPLHVSNLWGMAIIGTVDLDAAADGMRANDLYPIKISEDKGLAIIYVLDYREAGLGPYQP